MNVLRLLYVVTFYLILHVPSNALSRTSLDKTSELTSPEYMTILAERSFTAEESIMMLSMTGASIESLNLIYADMLKRRASVKSPVRTAVENNRVMIDGKFSGLEITSYTPLQLNYRGNVWRFEESKSIDANYRSFMKLLEPEKSNAMLRFFISYAHAQSVRETTFKGTVGGAGLGGIVGVALSTTFAVAACVGTGILPCVVLGTVVTLGGAATGGLVGGAVGAGAGYGYGKANEGNATKTIDSLLNRQTKIKCTEKSMTISLAGDLTTAVEIDKKSSVVVLKNKKGENVDGYLPDTMKVRLLGAATLCKNDSDALALSRQLVSGATVARSVIVGDARNVEAVKPVRITK